MADDNINVDYEYAPGEAGKTAYVTISTDKLTDMGYTPEPGKEKQALIVYNLNAGDSGGGGGTGYDTVWIKGGPDNANVDINDLGPNNAMATMVVDRTGVQIDNIQTYGMYNMAQFLTLDGSSAISSPASPAFPVDITVRIKSYFADNWVTMEPNTTTPVAVVDSGMLLMEGDELTVVIPANYRLATIGGKLNIVSITV